MIIKSAHDRGYSESSWLRSFHTFSFAGYQDPNWMGFSHLRVINEDIVQPDSGFATHPHRNMEIITIVLDGTLSHQDSTGETGIITPGEVQIMSAGSGITHSEFNGSSDASVHFLQIWIEPNVQDINPSYQQFSYHDHIKPGQWLPVASSNQHGLGHIHQDATLSILQFQTGDQIEIENTASRQSWIHIAQGQLNLNDMALQAGNGIGLVEAEHLSATATSDGLALHFDLA